MPWMAPWDPPQLRQESLLDPSPKWCSCAPWATYARPLLEDPCPSQPTWISHLARSMPVWQSLFGHRWTLETCEEANSNLDYQALPLQRDEQEMWWNTSSLPFRRSCPWNWPSDSIPWGLPAWTCCSSHRLSALRWVPCLDRFRRSRQWRERADEWNCSTAHRE